MDTGPKNPTEIQAIITGDNSDEFLNSIKKDPLFRKRPAALFWDDASDLMDDDCKDVDEKAHSGLHDTTAGCTFSDWLLASAFPATTFSMGANPQPSANWSGRNVDMSTAEFMNSEALWPPVRYCTYGASKRMEWHHSDFKDLAYTHVYKLFDKWVEMSEE